MPRSLPSICSAAIVLAWLFSLPLRSATPTIRLNPTEVFDLPAVSALNIVMMAGSDSGIYFLLRGPAGSEVVQVTPSGQLIKRMWLGFKSPARLAVDQAGNAAVTDSGPENATVIFDTSGKVVKRFLLRRGVLDLAYVGPSLVSLVMGSTIFREPDSAELLNLNKPFGSEPFLVSSLRTDSLALLGESSARLLIVNLETGTTAWTTLQAPEIQDEVRAQPLAGVAASIYDMAITPSGEIFDALSPYDVDQAKILEFDSSGRLLARYVCILPAFENLKSKGRPNGNLVASKIAWSAGQLVICSAPDRKCAVYRVR